MTRRQRNSLKATGFIFEGIVTAMIAGLAIGFLWFSGDFLPCVGRFCLNWWIRQLLYWSFAYSFVAAVTRVYKGWMYFVERR